MHPQLQQLMNEAARLTRAGDLQGATQAIQSALGAGAPAAPAFEDDRSAVIDVEARVVPDAPASAPVVEPFPAPAPAPSPAPGSDAPAAPPGPGRFLHGSHGEGPSRRDFKLYVPPGHGDRAARPLVVMLHGCTQHPDDFAAGTAMNEAARAQGFYVLYPAQSQHANPQRCWNWFKHSHQKRGRGEPALLSAMTREVIAHHAIDPGQVYVAGLSAGGAMAAILGAAYPELFAAVGVHSGLAPGVASDLPSALNAMKSGGGAVRGAPSGVPTIVFHGDADATVHPANADHVIAASVGTATRVEHHKLERRGGRAATRRVHHAADGRVVAEHWTVHGSPHAWSGGSASGSYTDARGPDATAEMLRFFFAHARRAG